MKRPALKQDLVPVQEFRAGLAAWLSHLERTGRPIVLTQRGRAAGVLVTPAMLDELDEGREVIRKTLQGLRQARAGQLVDDRDVWAEADCVIAAAARGRSRARKVG